MLSFYLQYEKPATIPQGWGIVAGNVSLLTECLSYRSVPFILTLFVLVYDAKVQTNFRFSKLFANYFNEIVSK